MQHRVIFREITQDDLDRQCHFMPEEHEFDMHLSALTHDAEWLEGVTEVRRDGSHAITITTDATLDVLKQKLVPLLQEHWAYLRIDL